LLKTLIPREQRVITLRFGLKDGKAWTLEEVGREYFVTRERIRQIEAKAIRRLKHYSRNKLKLALPSLTLKEKQIVGYYHFLQVMKKI